MPYSNNPAFSTSDELRFLLGDTNNDALILNDDEIQYLLAVTSSVKAAAALGAMRIGTRFAGKADKTVGDLSISYQNRADQYIKLAGTLTDTSAPIPIGSFVSEEQDQDWIFETGMHDHPDAKMNKAAS